MLFYEVSFLWKSIKDLYEAQMYSWGGQFGTSMNVCEGSRSSRSCWGRASWLGATFVNSKAFHFSSKRLLHFRRTPTTQSQLLFIFVKITALFSKRFSPLWCQKKQTSDVQLAVLHPKLHSFPKIPQQHSGPVGTLIKNPYDLSHSRCRYHVDLAQPSESMGWGEWRASNCATGGRAANCGRRRKRQKRAARRRHRHSKTPFNYLWMHGTKELTTWSDAARAFVCVCEHGGASVCNEALLCMGVLLCQSCYWRASGSGRVRENRRRLKL